MRIFLFILASICASISHAQSPQWPITESRSPGGLKFIYLEQPDEKSQSIAFAFKDGTAVTSASGDMIAELGSTLLGEGTAAIEAGELDENLRDLQGGYAFSVRDHHLVGIITAPSREFPKVGDYLKSAMEMPRFTQANIKRIRQKAADSVKRGLQNPNSIAARLFYTLHLKDSPYLSFIAGGNLSAVEAVTQGDIEAWHKAILAKDNLLIVAGGSMSEAQAGEQIDKIFGGLPEKGKLPPKLNANVLTPARVIVLERDVKQSIVIAGGVVNRTNVSEGIARSIGVGVLTEGSGTSRLFLALREKLGATYGASASTKMIDGRTQLLQMSASVANDKVAASVATLRAEYTKLRLDGITVEELASRVTSRKTSVNGVMRRAGAASFILDNMLDGRPFDFANRYGEAVDNVTIEQVNNVIYDRLPRDPLSFVIITPKAAGLKADCVIKAESELGKCL